jgi:3-hydroxyisobutyrate dehydrogenase-like beta-hydroxyacid dehydrogenase
MEVVSEALVFAETSGLGIANMESLIEANFGPLMFSISQRITSGAYAPPIGQKPRSDLNLALKDVGHGITVAENAGTKLKVAEVALGHLERAKAYSVQHADRLLDSSSMYGIIREDAGLDFETDVVKGR